MTEKQPLSLFFTLYYLSLASFSAFWLILTNSFLRMIKNSLLLISFYVLSLASVAFAFGLRSELINIHVCIFTKHFVLIKANEDRLNVYR